MQKFRKCLIYSGNFCENFIFDAPDKKFDITDPMFY